MSKNIQRAKDFQKLLIESSGGIWDESMFRDKWFIEPFGADWDQWQSQGLMPINFCPNCGDDDLSGGTSITKAFSELKVQIPLCADCYEANKDWLPRKKGRMLLLSCLFIIVAILLLILLIFYWVVLR